MATAQEREIARITLEPSDIDTLRENEVRLAPEYIA